MASYVVGLTGGIGSGKSAVSARFEALGITVVDADVASRAVLAPGEPALAAITERFGAGLVVDGHLDRAALRARVFGDADARRWLERLTHPLIGAWLRNGLADAESAYALLVNPLLVESGQYRRCQRLLVVDCPETEQLTRTMTRDGNSEQQVRAIMQAQASRQQRLTAADDVIVNDRDLGHLDTAVAALHQHYLELAVAHPATANG